FFAVCRCLLSILHLPIRTLFPYTTLFRSASPFITLNAATAVVCSRGYRNQLSEHINTQAIAFCQYVREMRNKLFFIHVAAIQKKDRKSTRLNSSHVKISYAVFCLKKKNTK